MELATNPTEKDVLDFFNSSLRGDSYLLFGSQSMAHAFVSLLEDVSNTILKERGYASEIVLLGVGFRFDSFRGGITLNLGYSHTICMRLDHDTGCSVLKQYMVIFGHRKSAVANIGAMIRGFRTPNVYKAKGIRYLNEFVVQKRGKQKQQK